MDCSPPGSSVHGISPGKNTGVGCHALLQGIFPTQGSNPRLLCLLHWQAGLYHKSHLGSHSTLLLLLLSHFSRVRLCATPQMRPHRRQPTRLLHPWDFPGKSTGVGCHCFLRFHPTSCYFFFSTILFNPSHPLNWASQVCSVKDSACHCRRCRSERFPEGNGYPFQYSCLKSPMDRGAWQVIFHGVAKSWL